MAQVRLQKFLAECGVGSRRKMEEFILEGRIRVNGKVVNQLGAKVDPEVDRIEVNRIPVKTAPKGIMLLNKPRGVVSTLSDPEGRRTVAEFLTKHYRSYFPVGRLDWNSTGLMILTNDGEIAERLMHPRYGFERIYQARVEGTVSEETLGKVARGVKLSDGVVRANASIVRNQGDSTWLEVQIREGRNRVVRRLFDKLGHPVMKLKRTKYGPFKLGSLDVGQVRVLTLKEYQHARRKVMMQREGTEAEQGEADVQPVQKERASDRSKMSRGRKPFGDRPDRAGKSRVGRDKKPFGSRSEGSSRSQNSRGTKPTGGRSKRYPKPSRRRG